MGGYPGVDILLVVSPACENWCSHIWDQYDKLFSKYKKTVSTTINERYHRIKKIIVPDVRWRKIFHIIFTKKHVMNKCLDNW